MLCSARIFSKPSRKGMSIKPSISTISPSSNSSFLFSSCWFLETVVSVKFGLSVDPNPPVPRTLLA
ncbi:ORF173 [White spot syndrome virus]|uniref:ORF173 n=1 Tax=White spot syndrome virus TaxID=342409 RepID=A0A2D3I6S8_9VIRU|nr:ORF173 [White spot syndrome virus]